MRVVQRGNSKRGSDRFLLGAVFLLLVLCGVRFGSGRVAAQDSAENPSTSAGALDIMIVLDNSGSMKISDPAFHTVQVVRDFIKTVPEDSRVGVILFDEAIHFDMPLRSVRDEAFQADLDRCLKKLDYRGKLTLSPSAMERAVYELKDRGRPDARKMIIFMTDGIVDTGDKERDFARARWLEDVLTADAHENGIRIFSIAFTEKADFQLIQTLAQKTGGAYFRADKIEEIPRIFDKIHKILSEETRRKKTEEAVSGARHPEPQIVPPTPTPANAIQQLLRKLPLTQLELQILIVILLVLMLIFIIIIIVRLRARPVRREIILPALERSGEPAAEESSRPKKDAKTTDERMQELVVKTDSEPRSPAEETNRIGIKVPAVPVEEEAAEAPLWVDDNDEDAGAAVKDKVKDKSEEAGVSPAEVSPRKSGKSFRPYTESMTREPTHELETVPEPANRIPNAVLQDLNRVTGQMFFPVSKPEVRIGRNRKANDIVISKPTVSKQHAMIEFRNGTFFLKDLRSSNGTSVNHVRFSNTEKMCEIPLKNGDVISFDEYEFKFILENGDGEMGRTILRRIDIPEPLEPPSPPSPGPTPSRDAESIAPPEKKDLKSIPISDVQKVVTRSIKIDDSIRKAEEALDEWIPREEEGEGVPLDADGEEMDAGTFASAETPPEGMSSVSEPEPEPEPKEPEKKEELSESAKLRFSARCFNHPDRKAPRMCSICNHNFCMECVTEVGGVILCKDCFEMYERGEISL